MRFFELLNNLHILIYLFPGMLFIIVFGVGLGFYHFHSAASDERKNRIIQRFPEEIEDRNAPFPLVVTLIILGTVLWGFFYILGIGLFKVAI